ncbi:30573_t:CDS:2, partial [Racocetra persica]
MSSNQLFDDITGEDNMSFEYKGISNFENSFDENIISDKNIIDDKNDNYYEDGGYTEDEENNTTGSLPITSYFTPQIGPTKKSSNPNKYTRRDKLTKIKHCDVNIYNDDGTSKSEAQPPLTSTTTPTSTPNKQSKQCNIKGDDVSNDDF